MWFLASCSPLPTRFRKHSAQFSSESILNAFVIAALRCEGRDNSVSFVFLSQSVLRNLTSTMVSLETVWIGTQKFREKGFQILHPHFSGLLSPQLNSSRVFLFSEAAAADSSA